MNPAITFAVQLQAIVYDPIGGSGMYACFAIMASQLIGAYIAQLLFTKFLLPCMQQWKAKLS
jgi:glycerol uptake facilitator-like aquaporin